LKIKLLKFTINAENCVVGCLGLSPAILVHFTVEVGVAA